MAANQQDLNKDFYDAIGTFEMFILGSFSEAGKSMSRPASFFGGYGVMPNGVKEMNDILQDYYRTRNNNPKPVEAIKKICEVASQELNKHTRSNTPFKPHRRNKELHEAYLALANLNNDLNLAEGGIHSFDKDTLIYRLNNISLSGDYSGIKTAKR